MNKVEAIEAIEQMNSLSKKNKKDKIRKLTDILMHSVNQLSEYKFENIVMTSDSTPARRLVKLEGTALDFSIQTLMKTKKRLKTAMTLSENEFTELERLCLSSAHVPELIFEKIESGEFKRMQEQKK